MEKGFAVFKEKLTSIFRKDNISSSPSKSSLEKEDLSSYMIPLTPALRRRMREEKQYEEYGVEKERCFTIETLE